MEYKIFQIDAFADKVFSGNPAAVCPLDQWLNDDTLQKIAMENNLAATAFFIKVNEKYEIRWFTPTAELELCGHGTLAAAFVLFNYENYDGNTINFYSNRSGSLTVTKEGELISLNFPAKNIEKIKISEEIIAGFNIRPKAAYKGKTDFLLEFENEDEIRGIIPVFSAISELNGRGVIITAKGDKVDFVSRFFAPQSGINEDPATGSAHTTLIPYWAKQLNKNVLTARQLSTRKGYLQCKYLNDRVEIQGRGRLYLTGRISLT
ncbi:PhzF family phenazine biosynthesis protein [Zunongwangia sp. HGR-M22]|uniref:PhzF family phenazine biosynthesis protein n=1 Tax=Zunongwangia sp. HGR-M22 TaxID=3015168 RepID=UPI0022DD1DE6|nr:PhzF family phenazine biosynthesis protein [Zunongwangia sp. HGR-M22]WBL26745.1 PhzF family phenazine biosynthesis protein [Zunongwangia sp. HGR-M22]